MRGRALSAIAAMLMAIGLTACGSADVSNNSVDAADSNTVADEATNDVAPPPVPEPAAPERYTLDEAAQRGLISYEVTGRGGSTGAALTLKIHRLVAEPIKVYVEPGTVFRPGSEGAQSMVARSIVEEIAEAVGEEIAKKALDDNGVVELTDDADHYFRIEAYCRDLELENPSPQDSFTPGAVDRRDAALLRAARDLDLRQTATQAAIWMERGATQEDIHPKFPAATDEDFEAASALLDSLSPAPAASETGNDT
jgi:hypothetical protein